MLARKMTLAAAILIGVAAMVGSVSSYAEDAPLTTIVSKPSFSCSKVTTALEKLICSDADLAQKDNELAQAVEKAKAFYKGQSREDFIHQQRAWLKLRNDTCIANGDDPSHDKQIQCAKAIYDQRIKEITEHLKNPESKNESEIASANDQSYAFWILHAGGTYIDNNDPSKTYISLVVGKKEKIYWDPVAQKFIEISDRTKVHPSTPYPLQGSAYNLPNGSKISMGIRSPSPKCGDTVGVSYTYQNPNGAKKSFYIVEKLNPPLETHYCGYQMKQEYNTELFSPVVLRDNRLLFIDYAMNFGRTTNASLVISMQEPPTSIIALGDVGFLIPGDLLGPALEKAGNYQRIRYSALLSVLKNHHPAVKIQQSTLEIPQNTGKNLPPPQTKEGR